MWILEIYDVLNISNMSFQEIGEKIILIWNWEIPNLLNFHLEIFYAVSFRLQNLFLKITQMAPVPFTIIQTYSHDNHIIRSDLSTVLSTKRLRFFSLGGCSRTFMLHSQWQGGEILGPGLRYRRSKVSKDGRKR